MNKGYIVTGDDGKQLTIWNSLPPQHLRHSSGYWMPKYGICCVHDSSSRMLYEGYIDWVSNENNWKMKNGIFPQKLMKRSTVMLHDELNSGITSQIKYLIEK